MRVVKYRGFATPARLSVAEAGDPLAGPGEMVVRVAACGLGLDVLISEGGYQVRPALPFVPGSEIAGTVTAVGRGVDDCEVGDRVAGLALSGGLAEHAVVRADFAGLVSPAIDMVTAAACLTNYCTAFMALADLGIGRSGESVLILGAGGWLGMAAIDVARHLGLRPVAAASSHDKRDAARLQGAVTTVDFGVAEWRATLENAIREASIGLTFDGVGRAVSEIAFRMLKPGGRHFVVGFASGEIARLPMLKRSSVAGFNWGGALRADSGIFAPMLVRVRDGLADGSLRPRRRRRSRSMISRRRWRVSAPAEATANWSHALRRIER